MLSPITAPMTVQSYLLTPGDPYLLHDVKIDGQVHPQPLLNDLSVHDILLAGDEAKGHHN